MGGSSTLAPASVFSTAGSWYLRLCAAPATQVLHEQQTEAQRCEGSLQLVLKHSDEQNTDVRMPSLAMCRSASAQHTDSDETHFLHTGQVLDSEAALPQLRHDSPVSAIVARA